LIIYDRVDGYLPIQAYAMIGDCRSAALVGFDGSIDWLCLPRFDDASLFGRILDAGKGGYWQIAPRGPYQVLPRYRDRTNVLFTTFTTRAGRVSVTDFMPLHQDTLEHRATPHRHPRLVRIVECLTGEVVLHNDMEPAPDYARNGVVPFVAENGRLHADAGPLHICIRASCDIGGSHQVLNMRAGDCIAFALITGEADDCDDEQPWSVERARVLLRETREFWWRWIGQVRYDGPYQEPVWRSALALKLMTYSPTGAMIAAPTTSLPEQIGGMRNWDYRFTWLRDASFCLYAFFQLGLTDEANAFFKWLAKIGIGGEHPGVDNLYTLDGHRNPHEITLDHLEGYRGSRPVRVGNGAARQLQLDVYGEVLDSAYLFARFGGAVTGQLWKGLRAIVDLAIARVDEPDSSMWEVRGGERHFTYSKMMCWVAVDRGLRIAERYGLPHDAERWKKERAHIHRRVVMEGFSKRQNAFTQWLGGEALDASMLRMAQVRFLAPNDPRLASTVDAIAEQLREGVLVRRYRPREAPDGLAGDDGGFLMCSYWLVDAYAHLGRLEEAQRLFEQVVSVQSGCGLLSEEADTRTGDLLGNYPQAFTHFALVGAAINIERLRHRSLGTHGLR